MMAEHLDKLIWLSHQFLSEGLRGEQGQSSLGALLMTLALIHLGRTGVQDNSLQHNRTNLT